MKLIIGLGNPGKAYENTRHNIGFRVINEIARIQKVILTRHESFLEARFKLGNETVILGDGTVSLVQSRTFFMNESGNTVRALESKHQNVCLPGDTLIVLDDINLPLGKIRLRTEGSEGGHHGLESIAQVLKTQNFPRLRIGIGQEGLSGQDLTDFVLGKFEPSEEKVLKEVIPTASEACLTWAREGAQVAMNRYNKI